ncbi:MAG: preprotein translocase subunit SecE [Gammaproteobacteria bacterium]
MTAIDKIKLWSAALIVVAAVYVAGYELGADRAAARTGVLAGGLLAAALLVAFSVSGREFFEFAKAAQIELRKVIWPSRQETLRMTGVVLLMVSAVMLFLWVVDFILGELLEALAS